MLSLTLSERCHIRGTKAKDGIKQDLGIKEVASTGDSRHTDGRS